MVADAEVGAVQGTREVAAAISITNLSRREMVQNRIDVVGTERGLVVAEMTAGRTSGAEVTTRCRA